MPSYLTIVWNAKKKIKIGPDHFEKNVFCACERFASTPYARVYVCSILNCPGITGWIFYLKTGKMLFRHCHIWKPENCL